MAIRTLSPTSPSPHYMLGRTNVPLMSVMFPELDGSRFIPGNLFQFDAGTWTFTRTAGGNYSMVRTAGSGTSNAAVNLGFLLNKIGNDPLISPVGSEYWSGYADNSSLPGGGGGGSAGVAQPGAGHYFRGIQISGFDMVYTVSAAGFTSLTPTLYETVYANNTAAVVAAAPGGVITTVPATPPVAVPSTGPYVVPATVATPYILGNNVADRASWLELAFVVPVTAVVSLIGVNVYFNYVLL